MPNLCDNIVEHSGVFPPTLPERLNPGMTDTFQIIWDPKMQTGEVITGSIWIVPPELNIGGSGFADTLLCECVKYQYVNTVRLTSDGTEGKFLVQNEITTDLNPAPRRLSFYLIVGLK